MKFVEQGIPLVLTSESIRSKLRRPLGVLFKSLDEAVSSIKARPIVTVGDRVTNDLCKILGSIDIQVVDCREKRLRVEPPRCIAHKIIRTVNPPGMLTPQTIQSVREAISSGCETRILVEGEEDLIALLIIYLADKGTLVYGQPNEGLVVVNLSDLKVKELVSDIISLGAATLNE